MYTSCVRHRRVKVISNWDDEGFPGGSDGKESPCSAEDLDLIPGLGRLPGERKGCILSCILAWRIPWPGEIHGIAKSQT